MADSHRESEFLFAERAGHFLIQGLATSALVSDMPHHDERSRVASTHLVAYNGVSVF